MSRRSTHSRPLEPANSHTLGPFLGFFHTGVSVTIFDLLQIQAMNFSQRSTRSKLTKMMTVGLLRGPLSLPCSAPASPPSAYLTQKTSGHCETRSGVVAISNEKIFRSQRPPLSRGTDHVVIRGSVQRNPHPTTHCLKKFLPIKLSLRPFHPSDKTRPRDTDHIYHYREF